MKEPIATRLRWIGNFALKLQRMRFFTVSILIHIFLIAGLGSIVLFRSVSERPVFIGNEVGLLQSEEESSSSIEDTLEFQESSTLSRSTSDLANSSSLQSSLHALSIDTSFQLTATTTAQTMGTMQGSESLRGLPGTLSGSGVGLGARGGEGMVSTLFGQKTNESGGVKGYFYDLKQTRGRKPTNMSEEEYANIVRSLGNSWRVSKLSKFYQSPSPLYLTSLLVPDIRAEEGPKAFGVENEVEPRLWLAYYEGAVVAPMTGSFRFVGSGDDVLLIRLNGATVLDASSPAITGPKDEKKKYFYDYEKLYPPYYANLGHVQGNWFELRQGFSYPIEIIVGEQPGGFFYVSLLVEKRHGDYAKDAKGQPILPVFRIGNAPLTDAARTKLPPFQEESPSWGGHSR